MIQVTNSDLDTPLKVNFKSQNRILHLLLDLDHTLVHSTELSHLSLEEEYLKTKPDDHSKQGGDVFMDSTMITKLRPFVRSFLKEASHLYQMHIYTTGSRAYAYRMAELLDPEKDYFTSNSRVISCEDHSSRGQKKCLDLVRGCEDSNVLILDDTREAWTKDNHDNMIVMRRYHFFKYSSQTMCLNSSKSLAELKTDEDDDYLEHVLRLLQKVHAMFFAHKLPKKIHDVRQVLTSIRKQVLKGCEIVFDCGVLTKINTIWKMAEEMGATCSTRVDAPSVTHVVATNTRTKNSLMAVKNKKALVRREWIEAASYLWEKQPEHKFLVPTT